MKKILIAMMLSMPLVISAQDNTWEQVQQNNLDQKYLVGAVPEVDGHVVFSTTINAPGKSAQQIYDVLHDELLKMTKEPNQIEQSRITRDDKDAHKLVASYQEWLVFKNKPLNLDRTRFLYQIIADCKDGQADIKLNRIVYIYDEERDMTSWPVSAESSVVRPLIVLTTSSTVSNNCFRNKICQNKNRCCHQKSATRWSIQNATTWNPSGIPAGHES